MTLSWAAPAVLAAGVLLVLPWIAHLTLRTPTDRVPFGAMMLLERLVKRLRRRRAVQDRLLLGLRVLALLAALLAFTGPYVAWWDTHAEYAGSGRVVVVIDRSMSMSQAEGGGTLLQRARDEASTFVRSLPEGARVGLVVYGAGADARTEGLVDDRERVASLIEGLEATLEGGDLAGGLREARRMLQGEPGEVLLWTDEAGPTMIPAAQEELERLITAGSAMLPRPVHAEPPRNVAVTSARYGGGLEGGQVAVRAFNYGPDPIEVSCEVLLPDGAEIPFFMLLPAGAEAETAVTVPRRTAGGVGTAHCEDPSLAGDDRWFFHLPSVGSSRVMVVDGDPGDSPVKSEVYFLERALAPWGGEHAGVLPEVVSPAGLASLDPDAHQLVFVANLSDPRPYAARLRELVRKGGTLVLAVGDNVTPERYNEALGPILPAAMRQSRSLADMGEDPVRLALPDTSSPLFEPFRRGGRGGFDEIGSWRVVTLEPFAESDELHTLLSYVGGVPALVERRIGSGHVLLWTSTVDLGWSNLPLQALFMPLMQAVVGRYGGDSGSRAERIEASTGRPVRMEMPDLSSDVEVTGPDGAPYRSRVEGSALVFTPDRPGGYAARLSGGPVLAWVAANADPTESDVRRTTSLAIAERELRPELFERRAELAPSLLGLALLAVLITGALSVRGRPT